MSETHLETGVLITQARVLDVEGASLKLQAGERVFAATPALAFPYKPQIGDVVLAITQAEQAWVIGVIEGRGMTTFNAPADLELRAPRGRIKLLSRDEIEIKSREVNLNAENLNANAETLTQNVGSLDTVAKGTISTRAGEMRADVEHTSSLRAERINQLGRKEVKIDGDLINLG